MRVDGIARRSRHIADNDAFLAEQSIDKRGFPHIRAPHDGNRNLIGFPAISRLRWKRSHNRIEKIPEVHRIRRGNGNRVSESKRIEIVDQCLTVKTVNLIDGKDDRLIRSAQQPSNLLVRRR